jgi:hypothetical protein
MKKWLIIVIGESWKLSSELSFSPSPQMLLKWNDSPLKMKGLKMREP